MQRPLPSDSEQLEQAMLERISQLGIAADPKFVIDLIDSYAPLFEKHRASVHESLEKRDRNKLHYAAHSLKGAGLNVGASALADVARTIEEKSETADFASMESYLQELDSQLSKTNGALQSIRSRMSLQLSSK